MDDDLTPSTSAPENHDARPPVRHGRGPLIVGIVVAVVALAAIAGSAVARGVDPSLPKTFQATDAVPYSFRYPQEWTAEDAGAGLVIASPVSDIAQLTPEALAEMLRSVPEEIVVFQVFGVVPNETLPNVNDLQGELEIGSDEAVEVDGRDGRRIVVGGKVFRAGDQGPDNHGSLTLWTVELDASRSALFFFTATEQAEDQKLFDDIVDTIDFDTPQMEATLAQPPAPAGIPSPPPASAPSPAG
ncbi:MAG: hypothetical protein WD206_08720 [Actinomycetota bacterium]